MEYWQENSEQKVMINKQLNMIRMSFKNIKYIFLCIILVTFVFQSSQVSAQTFDLKGQIIGWGNVFDREGTAIQTGLRYLPSISGNYSLTENSFLDFEITANTLATYFNEIDNSSSSESDFKFYRYWIRYTTNQLEIRLGNQKINFGKAKLIRPLMWFDQIDPRDPIQFTEGVKALLFRYYFLNNANIWLWTLYDNNNVKGMEFLSTQKKKPEFGGRFQYPIYTGELAFTYHQRETNPNILLADIFSPITYEPFTEKRFALDGQWDLEIGVWFESALIKYDTDFLINNWQKMITFGADYTLPIGNGVHILGEHFLQSFTNKWKTMENIFKFSGVSVNYPLGLFDQLAFISFYNWQDKDFYNYINWQRTYDQISLNVSLFLMPSRSNLIGGKAYSNFGGNGIQVMLIYNH